MKNMAVKVIDQVFLVAYGAGPPTDLEWAAFLHLIERHGVARTKHLVVTDGGEPTAEQRRRFATLLDGAAVPAAIVTGNLRVRGSVTAISWLDRRLRAFPPSAVNDALEFLEIPVSRTGTIVSELGKLRSELAESQDGPRSQRRRSTGAP